MIQSYKNILAAAFIVGISVLSAACSVTAVTEQPVGGRSVLVKGPGKFHYLNALNKIYVCSVEGSTLQCNKELKINIDDEYHKKPGFYQNQ